MADIIKIEYLLTQKAADEAALNFVYYQFVFLAAVVAAIAAYIAASSAAIIERTAAFILYSEQIQHTVKINLFTDSNLIFRLRKVIKQKFEIDSTSESSAFYFEIRKTEGQIGVDDVIDTDKCRIFHCL